MEEHKGIISSIRNPLSIIALFVLLVELVVSIALRSQLLTENQRSWLIVFCTLFPLIVLLFFALVVWFRPHHLYGPLDYDDSKLFLESLKRRKLYEEVKELENESKSEKELKLEDSEKVNRNDLMMRVKAAEDLAFSNLRLEFGSNIIRDFYGSHHGSNMYDGVVITPNEKMVVEVKYFKHITSSALLFRRFDTFLKRSISFDSRLLAIVTSDPLSKEIQNDFCKLISDVQPTIHVRFYSFNS